MTARDLMQANMIVARPEMTVADLAALLTDKRISGAPVEENGQLVGVVSLSDIAANLPLKGAPRFYRELWDAEEMYGFSVEEVGTQTVRDIMTPAVYRVEDTTPIQDVARLMLEGAIHRVIVVRQGKAVGILTTTDLVRAIPQLVH